MFGYIRIFMVISLIFIVGAAWVVGAYYKQFATDDIVTLSTVKGESFTRAYESVVWKNHRPNLLRMAGLDAPKWKNYREYHAFVRDTMAFFDQMPVAEVRIYRKDGIIITTSNPAVKELSDRLHLAHPPFESALKGEAMSEVLTNHEYYLQGGTTTSGTLTSTYIPIFAPGYVPVLAGDNTGKVEAVLRIDTDVTEQLDQIGTFRYVAFFGIITVFVLMLTLLVFFARRAETIIAKQHEINLELTAAAATAESENRDKSMFLANISHELRTPLNAIIGFSEILSNELGQQLQPQHKDYLRDIHGSGKHLLSLINDILEFSKAEAGKLEIELSEIDGVKLVKNCIRLMIPRAEEGQITLLEDLPKKAFVLHTDTKKLKQVLLNLLSNSVKFTPPNGQVKVTAWHDISRDRAIFVVSDTGIGIAPKDISKVMAPFGQVDSALSRRYEGTGLGLPLSKRLVELLGGTFAIDSEEGRGTTITLDLPLRLERSNG